MTLNNHRFNPFTEVVNHVAIENEGHTIEYHQEINAYGIILDECVYRIQSLPFNNNANYSIIENNTGAELFVEVSKSTAPDQGEFRVDYDDELFYNKAFIEFNSSDNGKSVLVSYRGTGSVVKKNIKTDLVVHYPNILCYELTKTESLMFDNTGDPIIDGVVDVIDGDDDTKLPTEGAVYDFARPDKSHVTRQFEVADLETGDQVTAGDVVEMINGKVRKGAGFPDMGPRANFTASSVFFFRAVSLDNSRFIVLYADTDDTFNGKAIVGTLAGKTITYGSPVTFETGGISKHFGACLVDTDKIIVAYSDDGDLGRGYSRVATISGTVPTFGTKTAFNAPAVVGDTICAQLEAGKVVVGYEDLGDVSVRICTVSGTTPTFHTEVHVNDPSSGLFIEDIEVLTSTKFVVGMYFPSGQDVYVTGCTVSGNTITAGDATILSSQVTSSHGSSIAALDSNHFIYFSSTDDSDHGYNLGYTYVKQESTSFEVIAIGSIYGGSPPTLALHSSTTILIKATRLEDNSIILTHWYNGFGDGITLTRLKHDGNQLKISSSTLIVPSSDSTNTGAIGVVHINKGINNKFVVFGTDGASGDGYSYAGDIGELMGIAKQTGLSGENIDVTTQGIVDNLSGLVKGSFYNSQDGSLNKKGLGSQIGIGISTTELMLKI